MKIMEVMTEDVALADPGMSIADAARMMLRCDAGALPVGEDDRLVGMITDRDIAVRAVAKDLPPGTPVRDVMSGDVLYCFADEDVEHVAANMGAQKVRRLPVLDRAKRLVGIVSIGDLALHSKPKTSGQAIAAISQPGGSHDQTLH
jgi:CBS domain-containing protein